MQAVITDVGLVKEGKLAPVVPLASIINDAGAWEDAGVLPPVAVRKRLPVAKPMVRCSFPCRASRRSFSAVMASRFLKT